MIRGMGAGRKPKARPSPLAEDPIGEVKRREALGQRIRQERERMGWSLRDLAVRSGFHRNELMALEAGEVDARVGTIARLAAALGCSDAWLLVGQQGNQSTSNEVADE